MITILSQPGRGNAPASLTVGDSFLFDIVLRDVNGNPAEYEPNIEV